MHMEKILKYIIRKSAQYESLKIENIVILRFMTVLGFILLGCDKFRRLYRVWLVLLVHTVFLLSLTLLKRI